MNNKEGLIEIVEALDACDKARRGLYIAPVARVHSLWNDEERIYWFTNKLYHPRELSSLRQFGIFVPKYSDLAIQMQKSKVGTSFLHSAINSIKRVETYRIYLDNQSNLQNQTITIAGDDLKYQYRNVREFLTALRRNSVDIRDVEFKISELEEKKKESIARQERSRINNSISKLQEEYRILTQQQEDLKNITIYIRKQGEMRYSQIVDPIQTGIMSDNLFDGKTVIIKGGPGTGKTTTMIHRLAYLTNTFAIKEDEKKKLNKFKLSPTQRKELLNAIKENRDWMFFSPSQMLKEYLAAAMKKEGLTNTTEKVWNWKDYCRTILQEYYHLLEMPGSKAPFRVCYLTDTLFYQNCDIITEFEHFYLDQLRLINSQLPPIGDERKKYRWTSIAQNIQKMLEDIESFDLPRFVSVFVSLEAVYGNDCKELLAESQHALNDLTEKVCNLLEKNKEIKSDIESIFEITADDLFEETDSDDQDEDRKKKNPLSTGLKKWLKSYCYSRVSEAAELNDEQKLIEDYLLPIIENKFDKEVQKIGELVIFEQYAQYTRGVRAIMLNVVPACYKKFRTYLNKTKNEGCNQKLLRDIMQRNQGKELHFQEQALLLGFINTLVKQIKRATRDKFYHEYIEAYEEVSRPIIGIDEATDFSVCEIYAIQSLLSRDFYSLTICGDRMQRMTSYGIASWSELDSVVVNPKPIEMKTSYRQSKKLLEVARSLCEDTLKEKPNYVAFMKSGKVPAPLVYVDENENNKIQWISKRISEVYRAYGEKLPSIAVFVTDKGYIPQFIANLQETEFFKEKGIKVIDGTNTSNIPENHICVYSIDVVKGMEFDVVFFHNIDKSDAEMDLLKRYIYVGVSRAAFFLGITMNEENKAISSYFVKNKDWFNV